MRIFGIDPGLTIGLAWYDPDTKAFHATQTNFPYFARTWLECNYTGHSETNIFVVEDYLSAGHLTKEAKTTIKLVGFFEYYIDYAWGSVQLRAPQKRLSGLALADKLAADIPGPHSHDALAHAIVEARSH